MGEEQQPEVTNKRSLILNFGNLAFGEYASRIFGFFTSVYLARVLGVEGFGMYGFVSSVATYFILFSNFGIEQFSSMKVASSRTALKENIVGKVIGTRLILSAVFIIPFIIFGILYASSETIVLLFLSQTVFIAACAFNMQFYFIALKDLSILSITKIAASSFIFLGTILFVSETPDLPLAALIVGVVTLVTMLGSVKYIVHRNDWDGTLPNFASIRTMVVAAAPLGLSALMIQIYHSSDIIFLGFTHAGTELGYYTGAYRIISVLSTVPMMFFMAFLPDLAKINKHYFISRRTKQYITTVIVSGGVITGIFFLFAKEVIHLLLGEMYLPAREVFQVLLINVFVVFVNVAMSNLLIAWNRHKQYLIVVSAGAVINIIGNIIFIPAYGIMGAAVATVLAECTVLISTLYFHIRLHGLFSSNDITV
ncbi:MAG: flippase [Bacteroidota bacterium]